MDLKELLDNYCLTRFNKEFYTDKTRYHELFEKAYDLLDTNPEITAYPEMCAHLDNYFLNSSAIK